MEPEVIAATTQVCINASEQIAGIVAGVIATTSFLVNVVPAPNTIKNPAGRFFSRVLHFVSADIVTAVKK